MNILQQIGVNEFAVVQFFIFTITVFILTKFVFASYFEKVEERNQKTKGGEELALEAQKQSYDLQAKYELKARDINAKIKSIIDESRVKFQKQQEQTLADARLGAEQIVQKNKLQIESDLSKAKAELKLQIPSIAESINKKLLGK